jgi:hypothetical protein
MADRLPALPSHGMVCAGPMQHLDEFSTESFTLL